MTKVKRILIAIMVLATAGSVYAEDVDKNEWSFTPYFWLPSIDVTSKVPGLPPADIDLGFDDIIENFDVFALSARGEYWWGRWGTVVDGIWLDMETDGLGPLGNGGAQISDGILDIMAACRVNLTDDAPQEAVSARLMAGLRYHYLKQEITLPPQTFGGSEDWIEPIIAGQLVAPLSAKWLATVRADASGFGIGDGSDLTTSFMAAAGWRFANNWIAKLGYRLYHIDYSTGSGANEFGLDGTMHGPWIGISYGK